MCGGTVAVSGFRICTATKATRRIAERVKRRTTRHALHYDKVSGTVQDILRVDLKHQTYRRGRASSLQREQQTDDTGHERSRSEQIKLRNLGLERQLGRISIRYVEKENNRDYGEASEPQVDVKAPPPRNLCRKHTTQQRADDR